MFESLRELDASRLVALVESSHRQESALVAQRLAAVAALLRRRAAAAESAEPRPEYAEIDGFEQTAAEVAAAMNLSPAAASYVVSYAEALDTRLPSLAALLAEGKTDWRTVRLIITRTDLVTDEGLIAELDRSLAERIGNWRGWSKQRIVNAVDAAVRAADPDAARERREAAEKDRYIAIGAKSDGMADIYGSVAAAAAKTFDRRLSQLASQVCGSDPRTLDQRRADALTALSQGRNLACRCGRADCPSRTGDADDGRGPGGTRVVITVVTTDQTMNGDGSAPGYLDGYGLIDADQVRALAAAASVLIADPVTSPVEALRYHPAAALERFVRCRDLTCRFPGCSRPAAVCDLDHTIPFNHQNPEAGGWTVAGNLKCLCRLHHRLKTFGRWRDTQLADGTVIWRSPTGRTYTTSPAGSDLFPDPFPTLLPDQCPRDHPASARRGTSARRASRIARARKRNREQRPINEARTRVQEARKHEIEARKFRNHMRDMLLVFKGAPSTSPFCRWVNDPREPEELPADWRPETPPPDPLPDDPPF